MKLLVICICALALVASSESKKEKRGLLGLHAASPIAHAASAFPVVHHEASIVPSVPLAESHLTQHIPLNAAPVHAVHAAPAHAVHGVSLPQAGLVHAPAFHQLNAAHLVAPSQQISIAAPAPVAVSRQIAEHTHTHFVEKVSVPVPYEKTVVKTVDRPVPQPYPVEIIKYIDKPVLVPQPYNVPKPYYVPVDRVQTVIEKVAVPQPAPFPVLAQPLLAAPSHTLHQEHALLSAAPSFDLHQHSSVVSNPAAIVNHY